MNHVQYTPPSLGYEEDLPGNREDSWNTFRVFQHKKKLCILIQTIERKYFATVLVKICLKDECLRTFQSYKTFRRITQSNLRRLDFLPMSSVIFLPIMLRVIPVLWFWGYLIKDEKSRLFEFASETFLIPLLLNPLN